jgi:hypothetical protein
VGKILTLLAIALVLANAQCFVRCQLDSAGRTAPPCHSQSKLSPDHCIEQVEVNAAAAVPQLVIAALPDPASIERLAASSPIREAIDTSPPLSAASTIPPLRI